MRHTGELRCAVGNGWEADLWDTGLALFHSPLLEVLRSRGASRRYVVGLTPEPWETITPAGDLVLGDPLLLEVVADSDDWGTAEEAFTAAARDRCGQERHRWTAGCCFGEGGVQHNLKAHPVEACW